MKKNFKKVLALMLALVLVVGTIGAYFTSTDTKSDAFTIGQIEVELVGDDNLYSADKLTPNYEYTFTRSVKNIGINDAYVFMAITLPCDEVYLHDADGIHTDAAAALTQLFSYGTNGTAGVSSEWAPVTAGKFGDYDITAMSGQLVNNSGEYGALRVNNTVTYIYAYVGNGDTLARLAPDAETGAIFDTMKFANVSDTVIANNVEDTTGKIITQVYAIQADNVLETEYMTGNNADGSDAINAVWEVLNNAASDKGLSNEDTKVQVPVTSVDKNGVNLNATSTLIEGQEKEDLLYSLEQSGLANADEVDLLIDVKSDDFDGMADTTFDVSDVAKEGDTVVILHYDEEKGEWEHIATETVDANLTVGGDFSSYSPVAFVVIPAAMPTYSLMSGSKFNSTLSTAAGDDLATVTSLNFGEYEVPAGATTYDVSATADGSVLMWNDNGSVYVTGADGKGGVFVLNEYAGSMFRNCSGLTSLDLSSLDTSNVTNMSQMFYNCSNLVSLNVSSFSTEKVTNMGSMFQRCSSLTELDVSSFDTSNVTSMSSMFNNCANLQSLDLSNFNTANVREVVQMFNSCSSLTELDVSSFNTAQMSDMSDMFRNCSSLTTLDVSGFNTESATNMFAMFSGCSNLTTLDVSGFNTANVTNMWFMFNGCSSLTTLDLSNFDVSSVVFVDDPRRPSGLGYMFQNCFELQTVYASDWTGMTSLAGEGMFFNCTSLAGAVAFDINQIDISMANTTTGYFTAKP